MIKKTFGCFNPSSTAHLVDDKPSLDNIKPILEQSEIVIKIRAR